MNHYITSTWIVGILLVISSLTAGDNQRKVKRQLREGERRDDARVGDGTDPYPTYTAVPKTDFSCDVRGPGYYADMETQCQVFHICHGRAMHSFICPSGTIFNQRAFVCDWWYNVDCASSSDFFALNSRIGSDEPFRTSASVASRPAAASAGPQLGSSSRTRTQTARPGGRARGAASSAAGADGTRRGRVLSGKAASRTSNSLLPNEFSVEVPTFIAKDVERERVEVPSQPEEVAEKQEEPRVPQGKRGSQRKPAGSSGRRQSSRTSSSSPPRGEDRRYLPTVVADDSPARITEERAQYLPEEGSGNAPSDTGRGAYLPQKEPKDGTASSNSIADLPKEGPEEGSSGSERGAYLPEKKPEGSPSSSRGAYLPETNSIVSKSKSQKSESDGSYLDETPPAADVPDVSFLLPPSQLPGIQGGLEELFAASPAVDEYSPGTTTTVAPPLPPMNLLPLSNGARAPAGEGRLPSTTESYGVLEEDSLGVQRLDAETPPAARQPARNRQNPINSILRGEKPSDAELGLDTVAEGPAESAQRAEPTAEFEYDFDRVVSGLQDRLRGVETFDKPATSLKKPTAAASAGRSLAPPSGGVPPSPWLYSLSGVPV